VTIALFKGKPSPETIGHMSFHLPGMTTLRKALDHLKRTGVEVEDPGDEIGPEASGSPNMGLWFHDLDGYRWELSVLGGAREKQRRQGKSRKQWNTLKQKGVDEQGQLQYQKNDELIRSEQNLDGLYLLHTDLAAAQCVKEQVLVNYKNLLAVEDAFCQLGKGFALDIPLGCSVSQGHSPR
jgi:hypothetical protein